MKFRSDVGRLHHRRSASTRAPATPAPTSATCGRPAARCSPRRPSPARPPRLAAGQLRRARSRSTPNTTYVASYHAPNGRYAADAQLLRRRRASTARRCTRSPTASTAPNGVYSYGPAAASRPSTFNASNYWVDVVFDDDVGPDTTPPDGQLALARPAARPASPPSANVTATFSEPMDPATINGTNVRAARRRRTRSVPATVTYDAAHADGDARPERRARELDHLHGDGQGRRRRASRTRPATRWPPTHAGRSRPPPRRRRRPTRGRAGRSW